MLSALKMSVQSHQNHISCFRFDSMLQNVLLWPRDLVRQLRADRYGMCHCPRGNASVPHSMKRRELLHCSLHSPSSTRGETAAFDCDLAVLLRSSDDQMR